MATLWTGPTGTALQSLLVGKVGTWTRFQRGKLSSWGKRPECRALRIAQAAALLLFVLPTACAINVPMNVHKPNLQVANKIPLRATVLIPEGLRRQAITVRAQGTNPLHEFAFPLAAELERVVPQVFAQVFQRVSVLREPSPRPKDLEVLVETEVVSLDMVVQHETVAWLPLPPYGAHLEKAMASVTIALKVSMTAGNETVWTRQTEHTESGPWLWHVLGDARSRSAGTAASKALAAVLQVVASDATRCSELWRLAEQVRAREKGTW